LGSGRWQGCLAGLNVGESQLHCVDEFKKWPLAMKVPSFSGYKSSFSLETDSSNFHYF
jgi:hypothetical protein